MSNWQKRYSFRLTEDEKEMFEFLEGVPSSRRSETIRKMLKYAYRHMNGEQEKQKEFRNLFAEIESLKMVQKEQHEELLEKLSQGISVVDVQNVVKEKEKDITEKAISNSANALLSSFGVDF